MKHLLNRRLLATLTPGHAKPNPLLPPYSHSVSRPHDPLQPPYAHSVGPSRRSGEVGSGSRDRLRARAQFKVLHHPMGAVGGKAKSRDCGSDLPVEYRAWAEDMLGDQRKRTDLWEKWMASVEALEQSRGSTVSHGLLIWVHEGDAKLMR